MLSAAVCVPMLPDGSNSGLRNVMFKIRCFEVAAPRVNGGGYGHGLGCRGYGDEC